MAEVQRYVDTDVSGGLGDGTSLANAYASMSLWEAGEQTDLVTDGDNHVCWPHATSGTADTTAWTLTGWTTGSGNDILIDQEANEPHGGDWNTSVFRMSISSGNAITHTSVGYVKYKGFQVECSANGSSQRGINISGSTEVYVDNCIVWSSGTGGSSSYGIANSSSSNNIYLINTVLDNWVKGYLDSASQGAFNTIYNCRGESNTIVIDVTNTTNSRSILKNNLFTNSATQDVSATVSSSSDYNATDAASIGYTGAGATNDRTSQTFTFVTGTYQLDSSDSGAKDFGVSLSTDSDSRYSFSYDFEGQTRSGSWDIGPSEVIAAGGATGKSNPLYGPLGGPMVGGIG